MNANGDDIHDNGDAVAAAPGAMADVDAADDASELPEDAMIVLPVRRTVLFPGLVQPITLDRPRSIAAAQEAVRSGRPLGVLLQSDAEADEPTPGQLHGVGTVCEVLRYLTTPDGRHHAVCRGQERFRTLEWLMERPYLVARAAREPEPELDTPALEARLMQLKARASEALDLLPNAPDELRATVGNAESAPQLADFVAGITDFKLEEKQEVLETLDVEARIDRTLELLNGRIEVLKLSRRIGERTQETLGARQREHLLREQLNQIRAELGETDDSGAELESLREAIEASSMPGEVRQSAEKELRRLQRMSEASPEHAMVRTYLEWLTEIPWTHPPSDIDIAEARRILDEDHHGLDRIKRRILEYLAVAKLNPDGRGPLLCFVGPPGVGKTSLGRSIARATGREFVRASLGGVHDESEIRGHRRTYVGALPGNIVQGMRKAGTTNPVFMLDEMDKLGAGGFRGDPSSALLEVLDPEQNGSFRDAYLAVPYDLSSVMFVATANVLDQIPGPLRDRMEVIELPGYTRDEKVAIARKHLVGRQLKATGLSPEQLEIEDAALERIVGDYTREAGVRNLERQVGAVARHAAVRIAEGRAETVRVGPQDLAEILGAPRYENEIAMRTGVPGVATGLAWTPVGGEILFVEANRVPGGGRLTVTGQLGDVMKESVQAALTLVKGHAEDLGIEATLLRESDVHVHVPAGAIPKDGPSAGVAMYVALASLLTGRCVRADVAMTGEISLRGLVLPIGGVKEKVLAAARAGIRTVMLPARNRRDFDDVPESVRGELEFVWLETVQDALDAALEPLEGAPDDAAPQTAEPRAATA